MKIANKQNQIIFYCFVRSFRSLASLADISFFFCLKFRDHIDLFYFRFFITLASAERLNLLLDERMVSKTEQHQHQRATKVEQSVFKNIFIFKPRSQVASISRFNKALTTEAWVCVCGRIGRNLVFLGLLIEFSRMATFRVGYTEYHLFVIIIKCIIAELVTPSSGLSSSVPTVAERVHSW